MGGNKFPRGSRKISITLLFVIPFLVMATFLMFYFKAPFKDWLDGISDFLKYVLGMFYGSNAIENYSYNKNNNNGNGN